LPDFLLQHPLLLPPFRVGQPAKGFHPSTRRISFASSLAFQRPSPPLGEARCRENHKFSRTVLSPLAALSTLSSQSSKPSYTAPPTCGLKVLSFLAPVLFPFVPPTRTHSHSSHAPSPRKWSYCRTFSPSHSATPLPFLLMPRSQRQWSKVCPPLFFYHPPALLVWSLLYHASRVNSFATRLGASKSRTLI